LNPTSLGWQTHGWTMEAGQRKKQTVPKPPTPIPVQYPGRDKLKKSMIGNHHSDTPHPRGPLSSKPKAGPKCTHTRTPPPPPRL
jgi:hypothetical protein